MCSGKVGRGIATTSRESSPPGAKSHAIIAGNGAAHVPGIRRGTRVKKICRLVRARDVWVVGDDVVLHWDGASWSEALSGMHETLLGIWQGAPDDVWMAGLTWDTDRGLLRHWNGSDWQWREVPGAWTLWEISGRQDQVWLGGTATSGSAHGFLAQGTGMSFSAMDYSGGSLRGIWGSAREDVWVAPYSGPLQHWDGSNWSSHVAGPEDMRLMGLSGSASDDVWAVGLRGVILHWDGASWHEVESGAGDNLSAVWASARNDVWAVGSSVLHWDGSRWHRLAVR